MAVTAGLVFVKVTVPSISRVRNVRADCSFPVRSRSPPGGADSAQLATTRVQTKVAVNGTANPKKPFMMIVLRSQMLGTTLADLSAAPRLFRECGVAGHGAARETAAFSRSVRHVQCYAFARRD
jgi:hypothetical protein